MSLSVTLSRNSWHYRLQQFVWGSNQPSLWSLCPYFWFTIFTILILPFYLLILFWFEVVLKALAWVFAPIFEFIHDALSAFWVIHVEVPVSRTLRAETMAWLKQTPLVDVLVQVGFYTRWDYDNYNDRINTQPRFFWYRLDKDEVRGLLERLYGHDHIRHHLLAWDTEVANLKREAMQRYQPKKWNPTWWKPFVKYTEMVLRTTFIAVLVLLGLGLLTLLVYVFCHMSTHELGMFGIVTAIGLTVVGAILGLVHSRIPAYIGKGVDKVGESTSLFINSARSIFKQACPGIEWREEKNA